MLKRAIPRETRSLATVKRRVRSIKLSRSTLGALVVLICLHGRAAETQTGESKGSSKLVSMGSDGQLHYQTYDERGDMIPDFSNCGYGGGRTTIPEVAVKVTLDPQP